MVKDTEIVARLLKESGLGDLIAPVRKVTGGYMHKMYQAEMVQGKYAIKLLNPAIMKRPDAMSNFQRAEGLEEVLVQNGVPVVTAMELKGHKMQCIEGQYAYLFKWAKGSALAWKEIEVEHCKIAGSLLAKIHKIETTEKPFIREKVAIDWKPYIEAAKVKCPEIYEALRAHKDVFIASQEAFNTALENVPDVTCICDGDMDAKNVLWEEGKPVIIDLECLDYGNPFLEMFQLALSWSGGVLCQIDPEKLKAFISAYEKEYGAFKVDWQMLSGIGYSWLEWLEYNVKRALMIECDNEEERKMGMDEAHRTIQRILHYHRVRDEIVKLLQDYI